jgi:hypothetical protein
MSAAQARRCMQSGDPATILDVRNPEAWDTSNAKVRGAVRASPDRLTIDPT